MTARLALSASLILALAACGRSDPADVEAEPDTVELPAERALAEIEDEPVMVAPEPEPEPLAPAAPDADAARDAGADAQDVAARAQAAAAAAAAAGSAVNLDDEAGEPAR